MDRQEIFLSVKESYLRCLSEGDFVGRFYDIFLNADPEIRLMFARTDFDIQRLLLRKAIMAILMSYGGDRAGKHKMAHLHKTHDPRHMDIKPSHYAIWKDSLLKTLQEMDSEYTEELEKAWVEIIDFGIAFMSKPHREMV